MSYSPAVKLIDENGVPYGVPKAGGKPRVSAMPYGYDISEGNVTNHTPWTKVGYAVMPATTETDIYSYGGTIPVIPLMTAGATRRVVTAHADDAGTVIKGDATGDTVTSDASTSTTVLTDADVTFNTAGGTAAVDVGDCVILDPHGASPEWGFVTALDAHTVTCANGFSFGGMTGARKYAIIDYAPAAPLPGCHAVLISYLDSTYTAKREIVVTNGAVANGVVTIGADIFRINAFRVIATGPNGKPSGAILLGDNATPPTIIYTYITVGFTRARNSIYTVPATKTLYVTSWNASFGANAANKTEYCRLYTRVAQYTTENGDAAFRTNMAAGTVLWYPYSEIVVANSVAVVHFDCPTKILPKVSIKVSGAASGAGVAESVLRGWLETT